MLIAFSLLIFSAALIQSRFPLIRKKGEAFQIKELEKTILEIRKLARIYRKDAKVQYENTPSGLAITYINHRDRKIEKNYPKIFVKKEDQGSFFIGSNGDVKRKRPMILVDASGEERKVFKQEESFSTYYKSK